MSFLLMIFLTVVCLVREYPPPPFWSASPQQAVLLTLIAVCLVGLHAFWVSRRVSWPLSRDPSCRETLLGRYERWRLVHQFVQFLVYGLILLVLGWRWALQEAGARLGYELPGLEVLTLAPFVVGQILTWVFFYDADRAAHRAAHRLLDADPFSQTLLDTRPPTAAPFGGRWSYVGFQLRQRLALVFLPVMLLILQKEVFRFIPEEWHRWQGFAHFVAIGGLATIFVIMPILIRLVLGLKPLPAGALRERLLQAMKRLGFRCSDVLLWNTRSGMANAMVIGLVPWLRYVVFTDRLVEEFPEEEVEAVFGHEVGHIRHQHMLYYLAFLMTSMMVIGLLSEYYLLPFLGDSMVLLTANVPWLPSFLREAFGPRSDLMLIPVVAALLIYIFVVFGFLSRRCERQADIFGCRAVSCADPACSGHFADPILPSRGRGLCPTGIWTFIRALEKVALVNGISRNRPGFLQSWQHSTISRRVAFLRRMLSDPTLEPRFQRRLFFIKSILLVTLLLLLAILIGLHGWQW